MGHRSEGPNSGVPGQQIRAAWGGAARDKDGGRCHAKVANMNQMRHHNLAHAWRLVVSACSCQSAAEPRYRGLAENKGMVECQHRVAVLPPGCGAAAGLRCCRRGAVLPPGCGAAAGVRCCRRVAVLPPGCGAAAGVRCCRRDAVLPPGCGAAAGLRCCRRVEAWCRVWWGHTGTWARRRWGLYM